MRTFQVTAHWDNEARVWWAESEDIPGLVAEAATLEEMAQELRELVPELLRINLGLNDKSVQFRLLADRIEDVQLA